MVAAMDLELGDVGAFELAPGSTSCSIDELLNPSPRECSDLADGFQSGFP